MAAGDSDKNDAKEVTGDYLRQAVGLGSIGEFENLSRMLRSFSDYPAFMKRRSKYGNRSILLDRQADGIRCINATNSRGIQREIFYYAHIASCCELFKGQLMPLSSMNRTDLQNFSMNMIEKFKHGGEAGIKELVKRSQKADALRTSQILRLFGVLRSRTGHINQLSFAAGNGDREIEGLHLIPKIEINNGKRNEKSVAFSTEIQQPKHILLIDNAPELAGHYQYLNKLHAGKVLALNEDCNEAMSILGKSGFGVLEPRNLIAGIRIDHRMMPGVFQFLSLIAPLIAVNADLVITVGAGHTMDEFKGRVEKITELFDALDSIGLKPLRINLHSEGTLEEMRRSPCFGHEAFTTYEILYCRLKRGLIENVVTRGRID